jgi:hypothetical protein
MKSKSHGDLPEIDLANCVDEEGKIVAMMLILIAVFEDFFCYPENLPGKGVYFLAGM